MTNIKFTKMNGLGNDFIILDYNEYKKTGLTPDKLALKLCDRKFYIGADGLIIINPNTEKANIAWIFYNSDGSVAQMCGNGMRCFAKYTYDNKLVDKKSFKVQTLAGIIKPELLENGLVKVNMGKPILEDKKIIMYLTVIYTFSLTLLLLGSKSIFISISSYVDLLL